MKYKIILVVLAFIAIPFKSSAKDFNLKKDLLLVHFDCKTDVDDLQTAAALATLMSNSKFSKIKYHAVAGTYGIQKGLYVPPNKLFKLAFGNNWTDANKNFKNAIKQVKMIAIKTLKDGGDIWIAEAGQSDFTAELIKAIRLELPQLNSKDRIHVVQHSDWNEKVTSKESLQFVKKHINYHKIADGNVVGNGTPGFRTPEYTYWKKNIKTKKLIKIWQLAIEISNKYNGKDGRYNNEAISAGGLDFSDLSEVCWILGIQDIKDTEQFFSSYAN
ncbi:hypothetical protein EGM88_10820 [Aureibaculum marinum]|uniref:Uncharacterized protein n=1 Tax=Aureibaculum marinum TaxID=2487930 RepID=A0A3N4NHW7_9FLAO|nr:hypothetical protein [Aureibaculum marinum]RPD95954.1 hypothetical protein EGM88_10820 [Aureibaculum marinum]